MDGVERAIRAALEKGDAEDKGFRERVYRQALAALDRAAAANPNLSAEVLSQRVADLQRKITLIESEFAPALGGMSREDAHSMAAPEVSVGGEAGSASVRQEPRPVTPLEQNEPSLGDLSDIDRPRRPSGPTPDLGAGHGPVAAPRRRRRMVRWFVIVTILAALAIGFLWVYSTGLLGPSGDGSVPNPPRVIEGEDFTPPAEERANQAPRPIEQADANTEWIDIFDPADPTRVRTPAGASAEILREENASFMRIRSGASAAPLSFEVGEGVLEQIAGRKAIFSLVARAEGGTPTQISVECDFGALGNCGRRRYDVGMESSEYLFDLELPRVAPGGEGTISIVTQLTGEPRAVDVFQLRVSIVAE